MRSVSNYLFVALVLLFFVSLRVLLIPSPSYQVTQSSVECEEGYEGCAVLGEESPFCGDALCNGFETCSTCEIDCGACPEHLPWWQVWGGHLFAAAETDEAVISEIPSTDTCVEPACFPFVSSLDRNMTSNSDGFLLTGGGDILADGWLTYREPNTFALGTQTTRIQETYSFFYKQYSLGLVPDDDFIGTAFDAQKPTYVQDVYFHSGDLVVQSSWSVTSGESFVILIDGNLLIEDPLAVGELITVAEGGFLAFVVSGDIDIADTVGHSVLTNAAGNVEGVYIADGTIDIMSNGGMDRKFVGEGVFAGLSEVSLNRDFSGGEDNDLYPTETFIYRPDFIKNTPEKMKRSQMLRQEV